MLEELLPSSILPKLTCPHCWETFPPSALLWVSQHSELLGDPVLGSESSLRFRASRFNPQGEAIDARDMACQQLACPRCHLIVPRAVVETEPLFLSIVGAPASGKSHFLAAMCWELRKILPNRFGVAFNDADTLTNHSLNSYEEVLFLQTDTNQLVAIRKTELQGELYDQVRLGQQIISLPRPFLFTLRPASAPRTPPLPVRLMCLYDNAGEHFQPGMDSASSPGTQHLSRSRAILFLFDPTQHPRFREACQKISTDPQLFGAARNLRQEVILNEAAARVRRYTGISPHAKHERPLIVVVSKADVWSPLLGVDLLREPLLNATPERPVNAVDVARIEKVSAALRAMLMKWTPEFVAAAEEFVRVVIYIPASALGHAPELEEKTGMLGVRPRDLQPRWVTIPLLYCLAKWTKGILPALPTPAAVAPIKAIS